VLDPAHSTFDVAQVLLDRGADPDAFTMKGNSDQRLDQTKRRFTALAGLFGGGSTGFANQPRHPRWREFAELLLSRGAGPADAQALKLGHQDCLEIALRYGLRDADLLQRELAWAVWRGNIQMVKLLLAHHAPAGDLWEKAMERGDGDIARLLEEAGAPTAPLTAVQQFVSFCMRGDAPAARAMLDEEPSLRVAAVQDLVRRAVETGRKEAVNLVIDLGFDPNFVDDNAAIHAAAGAGNEEMVRLLLARGASVTLRDPWYGSTAVGWADFFDRRELRDMLLNEAPICLQDAIDFGREDRAEEIRKRDAESELKPET
jgi:ankyrin repeat protein